MGIWFRFKKAFYWSIIAKNSKEVLMALAGGISSSDSSSDSSWGSFSVQTRSQCPDQTWVVLKVPLVHWPQIHQTAHHPATFVPCSTHLVLEQVGDPPLFQMQDLLHGVWTLLCKNSCGGWWRRFLSKMQQSCLLLAQCRGLWEGNWHVYYFQHRWGISQPVSSCTSSLLREWYPGLVAT